MDDNWFEAERLHRAARDGDIEEMARLVASGFDMNLFDDISWTPLHYAVDCQHYKAAQWLLDHGSAVNAHELAKVGETPLSVAVQGDYPEIVELLMRYGADPDITGWMGHTARGRANARKDEDGVAISLILSNLAAAKR
ncbi:ankyrin repeat domain-containing protein [Dyella sp. ASV21]|jgi:ankyrin repeat protein|uniref:ankyrin repeat domain-containing protein n=1 Tax=Dyella sp. ASV21 TaxID=2795114 RepID=UPI0018EA89BB|nr:ankyrin repeat domain-containing protein [Dyella sp. ASV21]